MRHARVTAVIVAVLITAPASARIGSDARWWSPGVDVSLARVEARRTTWEAALIAAPAELRESLAFLVEHMPEADLAALDPALVVENAALAHAARGAVPWGGDLPEAVFLNDVLPYASISERRERWREDMKARFLPVVLECATPGEAAHRLNQRVFGELGVKYSTKRSRADQSPSESMESGIASCTGLSILLTNACRAVGVPARLAGIPNWVDGSGNHTWVEVWDGGTWHFVGAAEPDANGLDHAWFTGRAALARADEPEHAIYALSYRRTGLEFPVVFAEGAARVPAFNVTARYAKPTPIAANESRLLVSVLDLTGARVPAAVSVQAADGAAAAQTGTSRDETFDANDHLTFTVGRGDRCDLIARHAGRVATLATTADAATKTVILTLPADAAAAADDIRARLRTWFEAAGDDAALGGDLDALVRADPARARALAWDAYRAADGAAGRPEVRADFDAHRVRFGPHESPYVARPVGERPENGWPLVIAMHGGGGAPKAVNDRGWAHMQVYYRDQPDLGGYLYLALRAPNDTWNGFYDDYVYPLVTNLIRQFLLFGDVDPDRVYLIGYSHGGYGAFAIGPKMPHRFAAIHASAAAPTDGQSVPRGLRTTPFSYMIGENDNAYGRRERCRAFDRAVQALRGDRDDVYPVVMEFREGFGHGGLPDRDKLRDLLPLGRNPHPRELSWEMTDTVVRHHFWLSVPEADRGRIARARIDGNTVHLDVTDVPRLTLRLDERLLDPRVPVSVRVGDTTLICTPVPSMRELCASLAERGDPRLSHTMRVDVDLDTMTATP